MRIVLRRVVLALCLVVGGALFAVPSAGSATTLPSGFSQATYAAGLGKYVTAMDFAPDGRLFVASQDGTVSVVTGGGAPPTTFVTVPTARSGERGLTGITLDPDFATNHFVYLYYAVQGADLSWHNRVSRFVADGDVAQTVGGVVSETVLLDLDAPASTTHQSGAMTFGADDRLYVATGDNLTSSNSQTTANTFGKLLRINRDGTIPEDNPYAGMASGPSRAIWSLGLRNPWSIDVQRSTGQMFLADVGEAAWEEVDEVTASGQNFGWPATEGPAQTPPYVDPVYAYGHTAGAGVVSGCAITGGAFYDPTTVAYPDDAVGDYFFADYCGGWIKRLDPDTGAVNDFAAAVTPSLVDLDVGPDGNLYYLSRSSGGSTVSRITYVGDLAPTPTITSPTAGSTYTGGQTISFSGSGTDTDEGALPASAMTWRVDRRRGNIVEPVVAPTSGVSSGGFVVPDDAYGDGSATYRITLTVTDSHGRPGTTYVDVAPRLVKLRLATSATGLTVLLDGAQVTSPATVDSVVGVKRSLGAPSPQSLGGSSYQFQSWSDGGAASHVVTTPTADTTFTASYAAVTTPGVSVSVTPTADSWANAAAPTRTYGTQTSMTARGGTSTAAVSYLRFKVPSAPPGKRLTGVSLRFLMSTVTNAGSTVAQKVALADDTWTETGLTWRNKPTVRATLGSTPARCVRNTSCTTALSVPAMAPKVGTTVTIAVVGGGSDDFVFWARNHSGETSHPRLTVTFG